MFTCPVCNKGGGVSLMRIKSIENSHTCYWLKHYKCGCCSPSASTWKKAHEKWVTSLNAVEVNNTKIDAKVDAKVDAEKMDLSECQIVKPTPKVLTVKDVLMSFDTSDLITELKCRGATSVIF